MWRKQFSGCICDVNIDDVFNVVDSIVVVVVVVEITQDGRNLCPMLGANETPSANKKASGIVSMVTSPSGSFYFEILQIYGQNEAKVPYPVMAASSMES